MAQPVCAVGIVKRFLRGSGFRRISLARHPVWGSESGVSGAAGQRLKPWDNHKPEALFPCKPGVGGTPPTEGKQRRNKVSELGFGTYPGRIGLIKTRPSRRTTQGRVFISANAHLYPHLPLKCVGQHPIRARLPPCERRPGG